MFERVQIRKKETSGSIYIPSDAYLGEPFVNLYDGILMFSGVPGGGYTPAVGQPGVFEVGSNLSNLNVSGVIYSAGTNLSDIIFGISSGGTGGGGFPIQNGINTFTGGTYSAQTVNITSATLSNLSVSGDASFQTLSATTIFSAGTNLHNIFQLIGSDVTGGTLSGNSLILTLGNGETLLPIDLAALANGSFGHTFFVSPDGDDSTAKIGDVNKPFKTIISAVTSAITSTYLDTLIYVWPGTYLNEPELQYENGSFYFSPNAIVSHMYHTGTDDNFLFKIGASSPHTVNTATTVNVYGQGTFIVNGDYTAAWWGFILDANGDANVYFEAAKIKMPQPGFAAMMRGNSNVIFNVEEIEMFNGGRTFSLKDNVTATIRVYRIKSYNGPGVGLNHAVGVTIDKSPTTIINIDSIYWEPTVYGDAALWFTGLDNCNINVNIGTITSLGDGIWFESGAVGGKVNLNITNLLTTNTKPLFSRAGYGSYNTETSVKIKKLYSNAPMEFYEIANFNLDVDYVSTGATQALVLGNASTFKLSGNLQQLNGTGILISDTGTTLNVSDLYINSSGTSIYATTTANINILNSLSTTQSISSAITINSGITNYFENVRVNSLSATIISADTIYTHTISGMSPVNVNGVIVESSSLTGTTIDLSTSYKINNVNALRQDSTSVYVGNTGSGGAESVLIGYQAGYINSTGSSNIFIGFQAGYSETLPNRLYISNSNTTTPLIYGEFDNTLLKVNGNLEVTGTSMFTGNVSAATLAAATERIITTTSGSSQLYNYLQTDSTYILDSTLITAIMSPVSWVNGSYTGTTIGAVEGQFYTGIYYKYEYNNSAFNRFLFADYPNFVYVTNTSVPIGAKNIFINSPSATTAVLSEARTIVFDEIYITNIGMGDVIVSATTSTINGDTSKTLQQWDTMCLKTYNDNYYIK